MFTVISPIQSNIRVSLRKNPLAGETISFIIYVNRFDQLKEPAIIIEVGYGISYQLRSHSNNLHSDQLGHSRSKLRFVTKRFFYEKCQIDNFTKW